MINRCVFTISAQSTFLDSRIIAYVILYSFISVFGVTFFVVVCVCVCVRVCNLRACGLCPKSLACYVKDVSEHDTHTHTQTHTHTHTNTHILIACAYSLDCAQQYFKPARVPTQPLEIFFCELLQMCASSQHLKTVQEK